MSAMAYPHDGFHTIRTAYDRTGGLLVYFLRSELYRRVQQR
jgi:hypothetical protein